MRKFLRRSLITGASVVALTYASVTYWLSNADQILESHSLGLKYSEILNRFNRLELTQTDLQNPKHLALALEHYSYCIYYNFHTWRFEADNKDSPLLNYVPTAIGMGVSLILKTSNFIILSSSRLRQML